MSTTTKFIETMVALFDGDEDQLTSLYWQLMDESININRSLAIVVAELRRVKNELG